VHGKEYIWFIAGFLESVERETFCKIQYQYDTASKRMDLCDKYVNKIA
jgi:hypothetical protein